MSKVDDAEMTSPRQQSDQQSVQIDEQEWVIVEPQDGAIVSECKNEQEGAIVSECKNELTSAR